jgi:hypothetical protein
MQFYISMVGVNVFILSNLANKILEKKSNLASKFSFYLNLVTKFPI